MSASSIELDVNGQLAHNLFVDRVLMPDIGNDGGDQRNRGGFANSQNDPIGYFLYTLVRWFDFDVLTL